MAYKKYTDEEKFRAQRIDITDVIRKSGGELKKVGIEEFEWRNGSQKISIRGYMWYNHYEHEGGNSVDFVRKFMDKTYPEALEILLGNGAGTLRESKPIKKEKIGPFELPEKHHKLRRVYAYLLKERGLDKEVVDTFVKNGMIYESADYHNVVFVGYNSKRQPMHATFRSTITGVQFRGNAPNSTPEFSFHWHGKSENLYLFEAPIDMLSFISMNKTDWQQHSYAACCGVGDRVAYQMMKDNKNITTVKVCLDNDDDGQKAVKRITDRLCLKGIDNEVLVPIRKDWNEDLLFKEQPITKQEGNQCQVLQP